ncbi:branched-chain amino acid ABC transporter ATP-binding protein/permease [Bradyrhizobium sp. SSUT18]|uniref:branched-chain amino acid ABC transporter ATP-binding protein/permease n=1 Tax=Bradyrhizobium sp. SSUT18 TaxID=3040602 RepID=UPI0024485483|nr:branched-chain amino acid ABC transporter ATP-binding protein/permease [Bradyrhizobium sp. SSUT18]MDH2401823.1 branched-chain amino acid ABC transporter ATP-binding protein/permease [Bradyrhizobium sp. SSUT18]
MAVKVPSRKGFVAAIVIVLGFVLFPYANPSPYYQDVLYTIFLWVALASSWNILGGYAGYLSFGHGVFFGVGVYTTATLTTKFGVPFLWTLPAAATVSALLGSAIGVVVFPNHKLRGAFFALFTLAITFVVATIIQNTPIDGGGGVYLAGVAPPTFGGDSSTSLYLLGFGLAALSVASLYAIGRSRFGTGLFAIRDDEDAAEVNGVPTFWFKMIALALSSGLAGAIGGLHAMYVGYVTVGETFGHTVPLYVVLMSILGGGRHWLGPAVGAMLIAGSTFTFTGGDYSVLGRAFVALALVILTLFLPNGIVPNLLNRFRRTRHGDALEPLAASRPLQAAVRPEPRSGNSVILDIVEAKKSFGGLHALQGVNLSVHRGEILGLVGPNGSGKTTLINAISGHFKLSSGQIICDGIQIEALPGHLVAQHGIARTYQIPRPFEQMTVLENVMLSTTFANRSFSPRSVREEAWHWLQFASLASKAHATPDSLNLHERKFLELARALAARPRVLLLDEVLSGLNPSEIEHAIELIKNIRAQGTSIIFVEHLMRAVVELSDRVAVLDGGKLLVIGDPQTIMRNPSVVSLYLGKAYAAA